MPRININEKDYTSPGASLDYANYAVLLVGLEGDTKNSGRLAKERNEEVEYIDEDGKNKTITVSVYNRPVKPDENGVYEFTSSQDFKETIGLRAPERDTGADDESIYHYGNQMAYELLKLGYTVIYKPIKSETDVADMDTWEIFKDKSNYDFRFISHGLLRTDLAKASLYRSSKWQAKKLLIELADNIFTVCLPNYRNTLKMPSTGAKLPSGRLENDDYLCCSIIDVNEILDSFKDAKGNGFTAERKAELKDALENSFSEMLIENSSAYQKVLADFVKERAENLKNNKPSTRYEPHFEECWNALGEYLNTEMLKVNASIDKEAFAAANTCIANLAAYRSSETNEDDAHVESGRGDCIALIELDANSYTATSSKKPEQLIQEAILSEFSCVDNRTGKYCALTVPSVFYKSLSTDKTNVWGGNNELPGSFHYLACFINSLNLGYKEWYAAAGYTRGVSSLVVDHTSVKLGEIAINILEPRYMTKEDDVRFACNVIANFRGSYYLWGNRTTQPLGKKGNLKNGDLVASSFLNIRHLCITIKKQLYMACRKFTFDPNSDTLWVNFCEAIRPTLEEMKADQGIRDYRIMKVYTDKKATLKAKIRIVPIEAVEDFILEVSLEDAFGETTATVTD